MLAWEEGLCCMELKGYNHFIYSRFAYQTRRRYTLQLYIFRYLSARNHRCDVQNKIVYRNTVEGGVSTR